MRMTVTWLFREGGHTFDERRRNDWTVEGRRSSSSRLAATANGKRWGGWEPGTGRRGDPERVRALRERGLSNAEIASALSISARTVIRAVKLNGHNP